MPDSITPVGAMVNPPNPQAGMDRLSSILSIQQQAQSLQTGQFRQQEAQAGAQSAQQAMSERQIMVQSLRSGRDPDGNSIMSDSPDPVTGRPAPDPQKIMSLARRWMPQTGDAVIQNITKTQSDKAALAEATRGLEQNYRNDLSGVVQSFKNNPNTKSQDVTTAIDQYIAKNPSAAAAGHWASNLINDHFDGMNPAQKNDALQHVAQVFQPASVTTAQNLPLRTQNAAGQIINQSGVTGALAPAGIAPAGTFAGAAGTAPGLNPSAPVVAGQTTRQTATGSADVDRANEVGGLQQSSSAAIELTKQIDRLAQDINSGHVAKMISETGNYLGFSNINQVRSQLNKDLGQVKGLAIARSGSDARAATVLEGYPTDTTPEATIHAAMDYIRGTARQNLARGSVLAQYQKADPQGLRGFQAADNIVTGQTNPLMHEFLALKPEERAGFYKRNFGNAQEAQAFKNQVTALQRHTSVLGQ